MGRQRNSQRTLSANQKSGSAKPVNKNEADPTSTHERFAFMTDDAGGVTVLRDDQPQSHVYPLTPTRLEFEYMRTIADVLDLLAPPAPASLAITHIGGAGFTIPRYVEATRAGSTQIVLEPDAALTEAVRQNIPLPRGHRIRVRPIDGATGIRQLADASADVIILDAFADGQVPPELVTPSMATEVSRVLKPTGTFIANFADEPVHAWATRAVATYVHELPACVIIAPHEVLKRKRFGNLVVVAGRDGSLDAPAIARAAARAALPTGTREGAPFCAKARPFSDADAAPSPPPPALGSWRIR